MSDGRCRVHTLLLRDLSGDLATAVGSGGGPCDCPLALSVTAWLEGEVRRAIGFAANAADTAQGSCDGGCVQLAGIWHAQLLTRMRDLSSSAQLLDGMSMPTGIGDGDGVSVALLVGRAELALAAGDIAGAVAKAELGVRLAGQVGVPGLLPNLHAVLAVSAVRQSDMTQGLQYARLLGDDALLGRTTYVRGQSAWAAAQAVEADQGPDGVVHLVERLITDDRLNRELLVAQPATAAWLVRVARALGDEGLAATCAQQAGALARQAWEFRTVQASALHAEALVERNPDKLRMAAGLHLDRWASASASEDAADIWSAQRMNRDLAVEPLKYAVAVYEEVGATRDLARVASKLRDFGVRSGRVMRPMRRNGHRIGFLTDTEFAVANLVSQGLTNIQVGRQLYISAHTVAFHLKKIFRKFEVSSRVELARAWANVTADQLDAGIRQTAPTSAGQH